MARSSTTESTTLKKEEEEEDESRSPALKKEEEEEDESRPPAEDEDTGSQVAPIVKLLEVAVTIVEENEDVLLHLKAELYRYDQEGDQLKERGVGDVKLLKHKETGKVRLVMRQNKTLKICANHSVLPTMSIQEHHGNETSCVWEAADFADGELKQETFCIRFGSVENCKYFKGKIEEITESLAKDSKESKEGDTAAELIEKLSVEGKGKEKIEAKEEPASSEEKKDETEEKEKPAEEKFRVLSEGESSRGESSSAQLQALPPGDIAERVQALPPGDIAESFRQN